VAGEAAVLGTPTVLLNPLKAGHTLELEAYGLIERHVNVESAMLRVADLSADTSTSRRWKIAKSQLLSDKADMTACLADIILQELKLRNNKVQRRV
jgi:predicted glycosyltransferase